MPLSNNPRVRNIRIRACGIGPCCICGKNTSKRAWAFPAPIMLWLRFQFHGIVKLPELRTEGGSLCLGCAKRIASRLDAVIDQIESKYK